MTFVTNFLLSLTVKDFDNRLILGEVMGKSLVCRFFDSRCSTLYTMHTDNASTFQL